MSKYGNRRVEIDGIRFDSVAEARRYGELRLMVAAGEIQDLKVHQEWELQPAFRRGRHKVQAITYCDDFSYQVGEKRVVEDVKGERINRDGSRWTSETQAFKLKRKLFLFKFQDIDFRVVFA